MYLKGGFVFTIKSGETLLQDPNVLIYFYGNQKIRCLNRQQSLLSVYVCLCAYVCCIWVTESLNFLLALNININGPPRLLLVKRGKDYY